MVSDPVPTLMVLTDLLCCREKAPEARLFIENPEYCRHEYAFALIIGTVFFYVSGVVVCYGGNHVVQEEKGGVESG